MNDSPPRDVEVFTAALEVPVGERAAYLDRTCRGNGQLRQKVDMLLEAHLQAGDFLELSPQKALMQARREASAGEKSGDRIGGFKLLQQIGEGGWGVVFMAEQEQPVRRGVALKIIKPGMDTKSVIARFEAERQALALMDHPNIAKVFEAGATESGRPYFVMELVRGIKITDYCDQHSLTTEERLKLFVQVCQAVQHAHQKGVIHRDIKPSNILVKTTAEGVALPVVIDFGIAKATTSQQLTEKTVFTGFETLIGTPAYMSPEQAARATVDVDTRTDIYSLGVLLYELLTGSTPFDTGELLKVGLDEIRRVIREQEPVRPSTRLIRMTGVDLITVAQHRRSDPPTLIRSVCGDLDWIAMKALEKDRARRYETANGLARDVQRYLANEPIAARPPSKLYKLQKAILRNKLLFVGIGILALLLIASLIVVSAFLARERQARRDSDSDKRRAQQATRFLEDMLRSVGPSVARDRDTTLLREVLDLTAERIGKEMTNQPAVEAELRGLVGRLYLQVGNFARAEEMQRAALAIYRNQFGPNSKEAAASLNDLGVALLANGNLFEAEGADIEALAIRRRLFGNENADVAASQNNLAQAYLQHGRLAEAETLTREALGTRRKLLGNEHLEVADSLRNLSIVMGDEGKWADAESTAREVLGMRRKLLGPEHPWVASALADIAWAAGAQGKLEEAESLEREALAMQQKLLREDHPDVAKSLYLVGDRMRQRGNLKEAYSVLSAALSIQRKVLGQDHPSSLDTLRSLGSTLEAEGKLIESEQVHREALALWAKRGEQENPRALSELDNLTRILVAQKKFGEAERLLDETLTPAVVRRPSSVSLLARRVDLLSRRGRWSEAAADAALVFEYQPSNRWDYAMLAALYVKSDNRPAYEQFCKKLLASFAGTDNIYVADQVAKACLFLPSSEVDLQAVGHLADITVARGMEDQYAMPFFQDCKALSEYRRGHFAEAVDWAQKPLKISGIYVHGHAYAVVAMAYWQLGEKDQAREMLAKGDSLAPRLMPASIAEDPGNAWLAWLFARLQLDEATALIKPGATTENKSDPP